MQACTLQSGICRVGGGWHTQVMPPDLAGGIAAMRRKQPRFECQQGDGVIGANTGDIVSHIASCIGCPGAGIGQQTTGNIDCQHRGGAVAHGGQTRLHGCIGRAPGADAQQGIDAQIVGMQSRGLVHKTNACRNSLLPGGLRISGHGLPGCQRADLDLFAPSLQAGCRL